MKSTPIWDVPRWGRALGLCSEPLTGRRLGPPLRSLAYFFAADAAMRGAEGTSSPKRLPPGYLRLRYALASCSRIPAKLEAADATGLTEDMTGARQRASTD